MTTLNFTGVCPRCSKKVWDGIGCILQGEDIYHEDCYNALPFGLKRFKVFEPETHWNRIIIAKTSEQAVNKAWEQFWAKLPFTHCNKHAFQVREL